MPKAFLSFALPRISSRTHGLFRDFVNWLILRSLASLNICKISFQMLEHLHIYWCLNM